MSSILDTYKDKLHPAIQPERVEFEMLTIGWYIVFLLVILFILIVSVSLFRKWLKRKYRRTANKLLITDIEPLILSSSQRQTGLSRLSLLLKEVAFQSYSSEEVAGLYGQSWIEFLNGTCKSIDFTLLKSVNLVDSQYQSNTKLEDVNPVELKRLVQYSKKWIGGHRV